MKLRVVAIVLLVASCATSSTLRPFTSDGCSLFPDGTPRDRDLWCGCCVAHDRAYWAGGTADQRKAADEALRDCIASRSGDAALARTMYDGVRVGGHPAFPTWYRWGYGWDHGWFSGRGYQALTAAERADADAKLRAYDAQSRVAACPR